jgi:Flp pilus assembly pilin Flp
MRILNMLRRLLRGFGDERGDDLVEYALLTAFVGLVGVAAYAALSGNMNAVYATWDAAVQELWEVEDPQ